MHMHVELATSNIPFQIHLIISIHRVTQSWNIICFISLVFSTLSFVLAMSKFMMISKFRIISDEGPLGGMLTGKFFMLMMINSLFILRCFFAVPYLSSWSFFDSGLGLLLAFLVPTAPSIVANIAWIVYTSPDMKSVRHILLDSPQIFILPAFGPYIFEAKRSSPVHKPTTYQLCKIGSYVNLACIAVLPGIALAIALLLHGMIFVGSGLLAAVVLIIAPLACFCYNSLWHKIPPPMREEDATSNKDDGGKQGHILMTTPSNSEVAKLDEAYKVKYNFCVKLLHHVK